MKKWFTLVSIIALLLTMSVPAFAAVTGTFVDEIKDGFCPEVVDFSSVGEDPNNSHKIAYELNADLGITLLLKTAAPRNANHTEYITYKMEKNIAGFELDTLCCAGLGNPLEDITVFISKTGTDDSWQQVRTQATKYVFNPNYYINFDKAYWHESKLMNASTIPSGYKYLKIQFNACNQQGDVPWNIAIDTVKITMGSGVAAPTISKEDKFKTYEQLKAEADKTATTTTTTQANTTTTTTTQGGVVTTTTSINDKGEVVTNAPTTTTSINANGEVVTDAPTTTTSINADGEVVTDAPTTAATEAGEDGSAASGDDANANADAEDADDKNAGGTPWILIGAAVLAVAAIGAAVAIILVQKKKQA